MELHSAPGRPLARMVARAVEATHPAPRAHVWPYVPPRTEPVAATTADQATVELCRSLVTGMIIGLEVPPELAARLHPDVTAWSPRSFAATRELVVQMMRDGEHNGDTITDLVIDVGDVDALETRVYARWQLQGRFTHACLVDDDVLVEPTGRAVETAGVMIVGREGGLVRSIECYYDDLALLEQLLVVP